MSIFAIKCEQINSPGNIQINGTGWFIFKQIIQNLSLCEIRFLIAHLFPSNL